ncbi:Dam family site-specific DNA-(adenine-N6)-methyltransferase [Pelotomaculum isophthalicicum]|uniref:Dam family site-specific DNA-(adenine-N6)-methyltransferase n=1 Tax=Pelotomaculum isophthalicicum TaxID=342448 RepID=UPI003B84875B
MNTLRPFLKWPGSKYRIVDRVKEQLPPGRRLIEPFVGSGAVFLNTDYDNYLLADNNPDLINVFRFLQSEGKIFIEYCRTFFTPENNSEEVYYTYRHEFNNTKDDKLKAALFLYLNRHGYNGLVRYSLKGNFNTPFGTYEKPYFPEKEMIYFHKKAQRAQFICCGFEDAMSQAMPGQDVCYCDPPYVNLSPTANFTSYSTGGFGLEEQLRLAKLAKGLAEKGIPVLLSNHDTEFVRRAYASAQIIAFDVQRFISCDSTNRGRVGEVLALFPGCS